MMPSMAMSNEMTPTEAQAAVLEMISGYWVTQIIYVAAKLGIFDLLENGPRSGEELARATDTHSPSLYRLLRALGGLEMVRENGQGEFETTVLGRCLVTGSPGGLRARATLSGEVWYEAWGQLLHSVQVGEPASVVGTSGFGWFAANPTWGTLFNEAMASSTEAVAKAVAGVYDFSGFPTIVDVGGGTGTLLAEILRAYGRVRGVLFDRPAVVETSGAILSKAGVADRCRVIAGDFFETVPEGGDAYVLSWIIHDWDDDRCLTILKNCRRAMGPDSRLLVIEQVVPAGNEPSLSKLYDLQMLVCLGGRERTEAEFQALLGRADLSLRRIIATGTSRSIIEVLSSR
jgi:hypothetical protein